MDNNNNQNNGGGLSIELKPDVALGQYSNLAVITHSRSEFIIDFAAMLPGIPKPTVASRIIMTPEHCKQLLVALNDNIAKYENQFGSITSGAPEAKGTFNIADFNPNGTKS